MVEAEAVEGSVLRSMEVDRAAERVRVEIVGVLAGGVAAAEVEEEETRARLLARVAGPDNAAEVDASARFRLRVSIQEPYKTD